MPKNVEDIIPKKRSIRDISVPEERRSRTRRASDERAAEVPVHIHKEKALPQEEKEDKQIIREYREEETTVPRVKAPLYREPKRRSSGSSGKSLWIGAGLAVLVLAFAVFSLLRSATLAYTPKAADLNFQNETYSAYKTGSEDTLPFSVVKISDQKGVAVPATGESPVTRKASGTIVVFNNASSQAQKLVKNTRFEAADGHVYRIQNDISIPGKSGSTPGSLEVTVVADQGGAEYNIGLTDFTVPGLKGDPRYTTIYARSKTPMTGGFAGTEKTVSPDGLTQAQTDLKSSLKDALIAEAQAQVPPDFILFPSLSTIAYGDLPQSSSTSSTVNVNEKGDFYGVIFKKADLADFIRRKKLGTPDDQPITLAKLDTLALNFAGNPPQDLLNTSQINFTVNGSAQAVWVTDENKLKADLAGQSKNDLAPILKNYPGIASADAVIRPFWKTSFPTDPSEITIKENPLK